MTPPFKFVNSEENRELRQSSLLFPRTYHGCLPDFFMFAICSEKVYGLDQVKMIPDQVRRESVKRYATI